MCVCVKGKTLQIFSIENNDFIFYKEISLPQLCLQMVGSLFIRKNNEILLKCSSFKESNANYICVACDNSYIIVNVLNSNITTLFSYEIENLTPYIANHLQVIFFFI